MLQGDMVSMLVAFVVGAAFTSLVKAFVADLVTPLIAAIFGGTDFNSLYFTLNKSQFKYGHFLNELISFIVLALVMFFCVVLPLQRGIAFFMGDRFEKKNCSDCLEPIAKLATKCKFCATTQKV